MTVIINWFFRFSLLLIVAMSFLISCRPKHHLSNEKPDMSQTPQEKFSAEYPTDSMIFFNGGNIHIGSSGGNIYNQPVFELTVAPFFMDKNLVTVSEFRQFIQSTGYRTDADKFGDAGVYDLKTGKWDLVKGANWEYPFGIEGPKAKPDHPVTQVSWNDAMAFCRWTGKRLPTEFEWECAARNNGKSETKFSWGNEIKIEKKYSANYWQGNQFKEQGDDGFIYTSPVSNLGKSISGLYDMGGNVWQWCANTFEPYPGNKMQFQRDDNLKSIRGGSFLYDESGEESLAVYFRSFNSVETSLFNMGFRCAKDADE